MRRELGFIDSEGWLGIDSKPGSIKGTVDGFGLI
jgi:hypothetical protein